MALHLSQKAIAFHPFRVQVEILLLSRFAPIPATCGTSIIYSFSPFCFTS
nr:MAG TPA: hypothetical protein [Caudoviricetes sp.]